MPVDLTRSILVVLIPGAVAISPALLLLVLYTDATLGYQEQYAVLANALVFAMVAIAGVTCESLGTQIEVRWDAEREESLAVTENWNAYLARQLSHEPIGYRYLSRLATMLYFELSMFIASIFFSMGALPLLYLRFPEQRCGVMVGAGVLVAVALIYFYKNAKQTHGVLCKARRELNMRIDPANKHLYQGKS